MMLIRQAALGLIGLAAGATTAAGVYALITVVGIIPRLAGKSRTGKYIQCYESAVIAGGVSGCLTDIYQLSILVGQIGLGVMGIAYGIFIGSLIMSLAETLDVFPIMARRVRLKKGLPYIVLGLAAGKAIGAFLFFWKGW